MKLSYRRAGRLLDYDYAKTAKAHGFAVDRRHGDDLSQFPLEKARLRSVFLLLAMTSGSLLCYGWMIQVKVVRLQGVKHSLRLS